MKALRSIVLLTLVVLSPTVSQAAIPHRIAVLVGANRAAPGRKALRYSHRDARATAQVLKRLAGFAAQDVHVLTDPNPGSVLALLDRELKVAATKGEALLFFYYSGHADGQALYPNGKPLKLSELRKRLDSPAATVRIGLIDACRGGGWTGTKGLSEAEVFKVNLPLSLSNAGSVLISSSSGLEDAHESEVLKGSFFTHHWNAALRGAADRNTDGTVTLTEAFAYAKALTIRDTARQTTTPQHPSFRLNLSGRRDLPLVQLSRGRTVVTVDQQTGPLQLVHLDSGLIVLEVPKGRRKIKLAVAPGRYLLRKNLGKRIWAKEIRVAANRTTYVREQQLELGGAKLLAAKSAGPRPITLSTVPARMIDLQFALGVQNLPQQAGFLLGGEASGTNIGLRVVASRGITDRWQWILPTIAVAYRGGSQGGFEWIPWGGLLGWGIGYSSASGAQFLGQLGVGVDLRWWTGLRSSLNFTAGFDSEFNVERDNTFGPETWRSAVSAGFSHTFAGTVTLNLGAGVHQNLLFRGKGPTTNAEHGLVVSFGSVLQRGLRPLPLLRVHVGDVFSIDGNISVGYRIADKKWLETYMAGATWIW